MNSTARKNCVIDCRVSDENQLKGGSLEDQEEIGRLLAKKKDWNVINVFRKPHSATTTERDDIDEAIKWIKNSKHPVHFYIVKCINRFTRMGDTEYWKLKNKLEEIGVQLIDTTGIIQPKRNSLEHLDGNFKYWWSEYSPSRMAETMAAQEANNDVREIITRLVSAEIRLVQEGYAVRRAPDGLKNKKILVDGKDKVIREPNPERVIYFKKMLELRADGLADEEIVTHLNAMGFRTQIYRRWDRSDSEHPRVVGEKGGKLLTVKQLQRYITQTEYAGVIYEKWTRHRPVRAKYEGIVSIETFNRANRGKIYIQENADGSIEVLHNYSPWGKIKRMKDNPEYPWKCILCPDCFSEMLGSAAKKKYPAYHCGSWKKGKRHHSHRRILKKEFEENVCTYLNSLKFEEGFLAGLELHLIDQYRTREQEIVLASSAISRSVSDLKAEQAKKLEAFSLAESSVTRKMLEDQITELDTQIQKAESERGKIELTEKSVKAFIRYVKVVMEHPAEILTKAHDLHTRRTLLSLFFEETPTYAHIVNGTAKLQPLFRLSEDFKINKSQLVTLPGVGPGFRA